MATKNIYTVTDLGPGDGGKGGVVHKVSSMLRAHTIIKVGGAQGSHGVATSKGDRFAFSQFGCGTFEGAKTHLTPRFVVSPEGILNEADQLMYGCGLRDVLGLLTVDEGAVCATPFHGIASRIKELARGASPRGTVGTGVGEAYRYLERYPDLTIRAGDLSRAFARDRLAAIRERVRSDCREIDFGKLLDSDRAAAADDLRLLDDGFLDYVAARFKKVGELVRIVDGDYVRRMVLAPDGVVVVESSHGVLTDHYQGFHPHTSAIRTLPRFTRAMLEEAQYSGEIVSIGVSRAYQVRHGAGPMPTADLAMNESLLPGSSKEENRYQGKIRVGPLDLVLLRYGIAACGGREAFDGLAITWFDQIQKNGCWKICDAYRGADDATYFTPQGELRVRQGDDATQLEYQKNLGQQLQCCAPEVTSLSISPDTDRENLYDLCAGVLGEKLGVPVRMVSFGPSERDKMCR